MMKRAFGGESKIPIIENSEVQLGPFYAKPGCLGFSTGECSTIQIPRSHPWQFGLWRSGVGPGGQGFDKTPQSLLVQLVPGW